MSQLKELVLFLTCEFVDDVIGTSISLTLTLHVHIRSFSTLPPRFPLAGPVVTVFPPVRHTWVNDQVGKQLPYVCWSLGQLCQSIM